MEIIIGKKYKAIGNCGMSEGIEIIGTLVEHIPYQGNHTILQDTKGQLYSVIHRTLKEV